MGDLEPLGAQLHGEIDIAADIVDVLAVDGRVDGEGKAHLDDPAGDVELLLGGAGIGADPLGVLGVDVLERDLNVVEPAFDEVLQPIALEGDGGSDQVRVKPGFRRGGDDVFEILAGRGLAARQMNLQNAHLAGLAHHRDTTPRW